MLLRSIITRSMPATSLLVLSSLAQAGSTATVTVGPVAATTTSVPTLSGNLLIVLGLLLAVIAGRTLRSNRGAQKILSILVLGGGLIISGIGVDRTLATVTPTTVSATGIVCTKSGDISYYSYYGDSNVTLQNDCANSIKIESFFGGSCTLDTAAAGCKVNDVLLAGKSCSPLPRCDDNG